MEEKNKYKVMDGELSVWDIYIESGMEHYEFYKLCTWLSQQECDPKNILSQELINHATQLEIDGDSCFIEWLTDNDWAERKYEVYQIGDQFKRKSTKTFKYYTLVSAGDDYAIMLEIPSMKPYGGAFEISEGEDIIFEDEPDFIQENNFIKTKFTLSAKEANKK